MAKLSKDEVKKLAQLSKIAVTDDEIEKFRNELEAILDHVEQLQSIDTEGVEPIYQVTGLENITREDEVDDYKTSTDELLANAPDKQDGQIKVPKVL